MTAVKSVWASVQGAPVFMRRVNGWLTIFWVAMIPVSLIAHWVSSVVYVSALSLWALVSGHWSAWQAARVEVNQTSGQEAGQGRPRHRRCCQDRRPDRPQGDLNGHVLSSVGDKRAADRRVGERSARVRCRSSPRRPRVSGDRAVDLGGRKAAVPKKDVDGPQNRGSQVAPGRELVCEAGARRRRPAAFPVTRSPRR